MAAPDDPTFLHKLLEYAWAGIAVLGGIIWNKHQQEIKDVKEGQQNLLNTMERNTAHFDARLDVLERTKVSTESFEINRKEVRDVQIKTFERLDAIGQSLARIEGKLEK